MGWFDEQLKYRKEVDDKDFSDALDSIADAIMGKGLKSALTNGLIAESAIDEILNFFNIKSNKEELPSHVKDLDDQLEYRLSPFGIMRRRVELPSGWYKDSIGPMLGELVEDGTVVSLLPQKFGGYYFIDYRNGEKVKLNKNSEKLIKKEAICFYKVLPLKPLKIKDLIVFIIQQYSVYDFVLLFGMMGLVTLVGLLSPKFSRWLVGDVLKSGSLRVLLAMAAFMLSYQICNLCLSAYRTLIDSRIQTKLDIAVEAAVMSRVLSLPPTFFREYSSGDLNQRSLYIHNLCGILLNSVCSVGISSLFSLVYIGQIFTFAPSLVVPAVMITLITILFNLLVVFMQMRISREKMAISSKNSGLTYSTILGIQKIKLAGAEKRMFSRWAKNYAKEIAYAYNPPFILKLSGTISTAISLTGTFVMYYVAIKTRVGVAEYYAFNASYGMVSAAFMSLTSVITSIANIKPILEMARPILETQPEITDNKQSIGDIRGNIELSKVSFRYSKDMPYVINDLSIKVKAGEFLAIVGSTGCGKSTLIRLLLGFEKPEKGTIYFDKYDIDKVNIKSLRKKIGVVMQNGSLFSGDICSNILISAPDLSSEDAWYAAKLASIDEDIENMPMGMNTIISEGQGGISGGQKQRLMIARALVAKPKVLILDEATSALDNITQKNVSDAIDSLKCTRIVVAHRLSTIRHADRIIFLDKGSITEEGTYEELIALNGKFAELVERQRIDVDID